MSDKVWMPSLGFTCKKCAGLTPFMEMCINCNDANQLYDQATKKCINCSVPGLASMNTSGWTSTTYPVETCTPCDAAKNEYEVGEDVGSGKKTYTCKTCEGKLELAEYPNDKTGNKHIVCTPCEGHWVAAT